MAGHADRIFVDVWMCQVQFRSCGSDIGHMTLWSHDNDFGSNHMTTVAVCPWVPDLVTSSKQNG